MSAPGATRPARTSSRSHSPTETARHGGEAWPTISTTTFSSATAHVGKSGLAERLVNRRFVPTKSSHARKAYVLESEVVQGPGGVSVNQETVLWDLAGQPAYRLVHQLSMEDAALACVLFDCRNETNPFEGATYWSLPSGLRNHGKGAVRFAAEEVRRPRRGRMAGKAPAALSETISFIIPPSVLPGACRVLKCFSSGVASCGTKTRSTSARRRSP